MTKKSDHLIEQYIDNTISNTDKTILTNLFSVDQELYKEYQLRAELESIGEERDLFYLRIKLQNAYRESKLSAHQDLDLKNRLRNALYYAAALTGITIGGYYTYTIFHKKVDPLTIYATNFQPYPAIPITRSQVIISNESTLFQALLNYQNGSYDEAIKEFKSLLEQNKEAAAAQFYLGISLMEVDEFEKAQEYLQEVIKSQSLFSQHALWYSGLCYLREGKLDLARDVFTKLSEAESAYQVKSQEILDNLSKIK